MEFCNICEIGEKQTDKSGLLDFEEIDRQARTYIPKLIEYYDTDPDTPVDMTIDKIKLGYLTLTNDNINYSLVPVWVYYTSREGNYDTKSSYAVFGVNALDGSIIITTPDKYNKAGYLLRYPSGF